MAGGLPPPPVKSADGSFAWVSWYNSLYKMLSTTGSVTWDLVNKAGSSLADLQVKSHELLTNIQGGTAGEHYHFTSAQHTALVALAGGGGGGSVSSVGLALPSIFTVSGSPVTSSGTLTGTLNNQSANVIFAGPTTGSAAPTFRSLVAADIPALSYAPQTSGSSILAGNGAGGFSSVTVGSGLSFSGGTLSSTAGGGSVTSVGLALPSIFTVSGSPVTGAGTLTGSLASQTANLVFASPNGTTGAPTFRSLVATDIPALSYAPLTGTGTSGIWPIGISGNAATVTTNANLTGVVTSTGNATSIAAGAITNAMLANSAVASLSGTNTGDNAVNSLYASDYRAANFVAGTNYIAPYGSTTAGYVLAAPSGTAGVPTFRALVASDIPALSYAPLTGTGTSGTWPISVSGNAATVTTNANLTGVVTSTGNATSIAAGAITNTMLANSAVANLSGTNTGDETVTTIKTKLGITTLSGSNTGDQTITLTGDVTGSGTSSFATTLANTTVTAGSYTNANITVDSKGRLTAASNGSAGGSMVYPGTGIPNSTGSAWGTSYTTSGTGTVIPLTASPTFTGTLNAAAIAATGTVTGSNLSGTNTGDNAVNSNYASDYRASNFVLGVNYAPATSSTSLLYGNGTGGFNGATIGTGLSFSGGILSSSVTGTVTSVTGSGSVSGLSLTGTVTTTGNLTLGGTLSVSPSNFSSQTANTFLAAPNATAGVPTFRAILASDIPALNYAPLTSGTGILKGNGSGGFSTATSGTDYAPATGGTGILKGNGAGGFLTASAGVDYATTPGASTSILSGNGSGGFSNVTIGSGLSFSAGTLSASGGSGVSSLNGQTGAVVDTTFGSIGSVVTAYLASSTAVLPGSTVAGSSLMYISGGSTIGGYYQLYGSGMSNPSAVVPFNNANLTVASSSANSLPTSGTTTLSGTWRAMGVAPGRYAYMDACSSFYYTQYPPCLYVRVS